MPIGISSLACVGCKSVIEQDFNFRGTHGVAYKTFTWPEGQNYEERAKNIEKLIIKTKKKDIKSEKINLEADISDFEEDIKQIKEYKEGNGNLFFNFLLKGGILPKASNKFKTKKITKVHELKNKSKLKLE